jgi:ubiquinol-cytochrome c reductase cytochrome b subunit
MFNIRKYTTRVTKKLGSLKIFYNHLIIYPTPFNLNYAWSFGSMAGIVLSAQIITGILLAMHYTPHTEYAFSSVVHLMTDVSSGNILRYAHANGASLFFTVVYLHVFRGMYYSSGNQPRELVWISGVIILLLMIITAFIGYVLPWGQMSFWGATVITSLATVIPFVGKDLVSWLWGGFSIDNPTLNRFYSFHYTFPFLLAGLSIFHIAALHQYGSTNPLGVNTQTSTIPFGIYFVLKDLIGLLYLALAYTVLVFFFPEWLGHPDNLIPANPYSTPQHIVPEWYFLWVYAILRSIPNKAMGVIFIGLTFASLIGLPFLSTVHIGSPKFRFISERLFWVFVADVFLLTWLGAQEIMPATVLLGQICTFLLFVYLLVIYPFLSWFESYVYTSIKSY